VNGFTKARRGVEPERTSAKIGGAIRKKMIVLCLVFILPGLENIQSHQCADHTSISEEDIMCGHPSPSPHITRLLFRRLLLQLLLEHLDHLQGVLRRLARVAVVEKRQGLLRLGGHRHDPLQELRQLV